MNPRRALIVCAVGLYVALPPRPHATLAQRATWQTGAALQEILERPLGLSWTNVPVAEAVASLSRNARIAILLDRRVDPDKSLTLDVAGRPLKTALAKIAEHVDAGYCQFGPIAYIGPGEMTPTLRTLSALRLEDARPLAQARRQPLLRLAPAHWEDLAEPRALVARLAEEAGVELVGAKLIPHDLWRAADLPPISWIDRLTLLAAQFDLTFQIAAGGRQVRLVPIPDRVSIARDYLAPGRADLLAQRWSRELPSARVTAGDGLVRLDGLIEDHEFVERRLAGAPARRTKISTGKQVYQFAAENAALERVVEQVAARLNLDVQWDLEAIKRAGIALDQLITVRVKDVAIDDLLRAIFKDTGLTFRRSGRSVSIQPQKT